MKKIKLIIISLLIIANFLPAGLCSAELPKQFENILNENISSICLSPTFESDNTIFVISEDQLYRSRDGGATWEKIDIYIDNVFYFSKTQYLFSILCLENEVVYLSGYYKELMNGKYEYDAFLIRSIDGGDHWNLIYNNAFYNLLAVDSALFGINTSCGFLEKSLDYGWNWNWQLGSIAVRNNAFASNDGYSIWIIYDNKLQLKQDGSRIFVKKLDSGSTGICSFACGDKQMLMVYNPDNLMDASISTDNGTTWQTIDFASLSQASIYGADAAVNGSITLCTNSNFILLSNDCGKTWEEISDGLTTYATCIKCTVKGDSLLIFAGTPKGLMRLNYPLVNLGLPSAITRAD